MVPLELPKVLEIPDVVVVVVSLFAPDEGVVQALRDSFAGSGSGSRATRDIRPCQKKHVRGPDRRTCRAFINY